MIQKPRTRVVRIAALAAFLWLPACGDHDGPDAPSRNGDADAEVQDAIDDVVIPPAEYQRAALDRQFQLLQKYSLQAHQPTKSVLYVNFDGATLQKGYGDGQSFILCARQATIPPAGFSAAQRAQIIASVQERFNKAATALMVTQTRPTSGPYTTMHVGGSYASLGCLERRGVLGVAPFDRGNLEPADIGFVFTAFNKDPDITADTIAHEAGHTYGLDHVDNRECLMHASNTSSIQGFATGRIVGSAKSQDAPAILRKVLGSGDGAVTEPIATLPVVPSTPSAPVAGLPNLPPAGSGTMPGLDQIASIGGLIPELDPSKLIDISALVPQLGQILPGGQAAVPGLLDVDKLLTVVQLAAQAASNQSGGAGPINSAAIAGVLNPDTIAAAGGGMAAIAALSGQPGLAAAITVAQPLISGMAAKNSTSNTTALSMSELPDMAALLSLPQFADQGALADSLRAHASVVNSNFSGSSQQALLSMLKVAYSQAYLRGLSN